MTGLLRLRQFSFFSKNLEKGPIELVLYPKHHTNR